MDEDKQQHERDDLETIIIEYLARENRATLKGKFFDVSKPTGKQRYAEWLAAEIVALNEFAAQLEKP